MPGLEFDFDKLNSLMPPINIPVSDQEFIGEEGLEEAAENAVEEVESLEAFNDTKEVEAAPKDTPKAEEIEVEKEKEGEEPEVSVIQAIAEYSRAKGLIDYKDEDFEESEDFLESKLVEKSKTYAEEWKNSLPEVVKEIINNYEEGIPLDELIYSKSREIEYSNIDEKELETKEELQKKLISDWLYNQDYTEEEVKAKLKKYESALILEDEAKMALKKLKVYEVKYQEQLKSQIEEQKEKSKREFEERVKSIEKDIMSSEEIIKGIKAPKEVRKQIFEAYTKMDSKGQTALTKAIANDPQAWYKITQFMVLMKGDLSSVEKSINTKVTNNLKETVNSYTETPGLNKLTSKEAISAMRKAVNLHKKNK